MTFSIDAYWRDPAHHTGDVVPFLLHSLTNHYELIKDIIACTKPERVLEIGSEAGGFSARLAELSQVLNYRLTTVEPYPNAKNHALADRFDAYELVVGKSLEYLANLSVRPEVTIVDGDHNYYTVFHELEHLLREPLPTSFAILLHDVGFPGAYRDMYYDPADIPKEWLHPYSFFDGALPGVPGLVAGAGFSGAGHVALACREGGPKNGVRPAIDDVLAQHPQLRYEQVEAVFGLGIIFSGPSPYIAAMEQIIEPYKKRLFARVEQNRMASYLRLIDLGNAVKALKQENSALKRELKRAAPLVADKSRAKGSKNTKP